jgi:hypothetical protein
MGREYYYGSALAVALTVAGGLVSWWLAIPLLCIAGYLAWRGRQAGRKQDQESIRASRRWCTGVVGVVGGVTEIRKGHWVMPDDAQAGGGWSDGAVLCDACYLFARTPAEPSAKDSSGLGPAALVSVKVVKRP